MESVNDNDTRSQSSRELNAMFRPPVNRAMRTLDRSFFRKTVPLAAAKVFKDKDISAVRATLSKSHDLLVVPRLSNVRQITDQDGVFRALLLREDLKADGA